MTILEVTQSIFENFGACCAIAGAKYGTEMTRAPMKARTLEVNFDTGLSIVEITAKHSG